MNGREESTQERVLSDGSIVEVRVRPTIAEKQAAAELAIAYLEGKPTQTSVTATVDVAPDALDDNALRARVADILARFAAPALPDAAARVIEAERVPAALPDKAATS